MSTSSVLAWTLREIARLERGDGEREALRPPRLTERDQVRWQRVRRKLGWVAFIELLHEDLAEAFPTAFALDRWAEHPSDGLDEAKALELIDAAALPDETDRLAFLRLVARGLGLRDGGNVAALPKVQPGQRALELPGTGGRIAAYQAINYGLSFHDRFVFVADTDAERVAIGIAAAELRANEPQILTSAELRSARTRFDHVFGIEGYPSADLLASELSLEVRWA